MIDSITFHTTDRTARLWKHNTPPENQRRTDEHTFKGNIGNMKILETMDGVTITGSIARYLQGQNIEPLTREKYADALKKLENDTGIDFHKGILRRVDMGASIITQFTAAEYMRLFDVMPVYELIPRKDINGLKQVLYCTRKGAFEFAAYDKIKELTEKKEIIPDFYKNSNVLRLEYRIIRRQGIKAKLGNGKDVTPWELAEKDRYRELQNLFYKFYKSIPKKGRRVFVDGGKEITPKEVNDVIAESFRQINPNEYRALIQTLSDRGRLSEKSKERIREQERKNARNYAFSDTNGLIAELDAKMRIRTQ